ncbi:MAG: PD-(D/E)XK nuclease family protein [Bryobacteraceae bacterium]
MAPEIEPAALEFSAQGIIGGVAVRGFVDLLDTSGRIIDLKTAARKPTGVSADYAFQLATYAKLCPGANGKARVDTLVATKSPQVVTQEYTVSPADGKLIQKLYPLVREAMREGIYLPNRSNNLCGRKHCNFADACEDEFGGRVQGGRGGVGVIRGRSVGRLAPTCASRRKGSPPRHGGAVTDAGHPRPPAYFLPPPASSRRR